MFRCGNTEHLAANTIFASMGLCGGPRKAPVGSKFLVAPVLALSQAFGPHWRTSFARRRLAEFAAPRSWARPLLATINPRARSATRLSSECPRRAQLLPHWQPVQCQALVYRARENAA